MQLAQYSCARACGCMRMRTRALLRAWRLTMSLRCRTEISVRLAAAQDVEANRTASKHAGYCSW